MARFDLDGAAVVLTGGSRGIGPYIAAALATRGARIALVARTGGELQEQAEQLQATGATAVAVVADVTSRPGIERIAETTQRQLGPIDVLVNNAGGDLQREFHRLSEPEIEQILALNLTSAMLLARRLLPGMLERGRGHIVNVSSMAGRVAFPLSEPYAAAKDGLIAFTRVLRGDYRTRGVSASTLILGPVGEVGVGARTAEQLALDLPRFGLVAPEKVGAAAVKAIERDRAETVVLPGPGKALRAVLDVFPGLGPRLNRAAGTDATMRRIAAFREGAERVA
jgi:short-subunit dehydrogenase